uniref:hypothetical protein n=1 Tax=Methanopyrus sp. SNP6 TaxID=1937005 RepID=UPI001AEF4D39
LACLMLLERLPRLEEPPEFRLDPEVIMDYTKRAIYAVIIFRLSSVEYYVADWVSKLLAWVWLGDDKLASNVWDDVSAGVGAPVIEEPLKRLASELTGLSRLLIGVLHGFLEWVYYKEAPNDLQVLSLRLSLHVSYTVIPLPVGMLLHSLYNSETSLDDWTSLLTPILSIIEGLIINAITGVW